MTHQDPDQPVRETYAAETRETTVVRERDSNVGWWIAGVVALAAIAAVLWMVLASNSGRDDMEDALEAARMEAQLAGAQARIDAAGDAAARAAADAARATADARDAAARAASEPPTIVVETPPAPAEPEPAPVLD